MSSLHVPPGCGISSAMFQREPKVYTFLRMCMRVCLYTCVCLGVMVNFWWLLLGLGCFQRGDFLVWFCVPTLGFLVVSHWDSALLLRSDNIRLVWVPQVRAQRFTFQCYLKDRWVFEGDVRPYWIEAAIANRKKKKKKKDSSMGINELLLALNADSGKWSFKWWVIDERIHHPSGVRKQQWL